MADPAAKTQHGYLILADISGYTSFIAGTELEHAQAIISELLEVILGKFSPLLTLAKLEGDAVFCYAPESRVTRSETLLDLVDSTYVAFRDRRDAVHRRTTCTCAACRSISKLDLKFMVHHGDFVVQDIAGIKELAGSAVNLVHRLLKNHVAETAGWRAYALFTATGLEHIGVPRDGMLEQSESYEHLGLVVTFSFDLNQRYQELVKARRVALAPGEADFDMVHDFRVPPPVAWEWINDPVRRNVYNGGQVTWTSLARPAGRTQVGASNHCAHGSGVSIETIVDWRPFEYVTTESTQNGEKFVVETVRFEPLPGDGGTRVHHYLRVFMPLPAFLRRIVFAFILTRINKYDHAIAEAARLSAQEWQSGRAAGETTGGAAVVV